MDDEERAEYKLYIKGDIQSSCVEVVSYTKESK